VHLQPDKITSWQKELAAALIHRNRAAPCIKKSRRRSPACFRRGREAPTASGRGRYPRKPEQSRSRPPDRTKEPHDLRDSQHYGLLLSKRHVVAKAGLLLKRLRHSRSSTGRGRDFSADEPHRHRRSGGRRERRINRLRRPLANRSHETALIKEGVRWAAPRSRTFPSSSCA